MKHMKVAVLACCALTSCGYALRANADEGKWTLGVSGGTLGLGPEVAYRYGKHLGARLNGGFYSYDDSRELDDIDYDGELKLNSFGLLADWYPFGGGFRLSLGARANSNEIELQAMPAGNVEIGGTFYTPAQIGRLNGTVTTGSFAPTLSFGYGGSLAKGFTLGAEFGVMFQGSPQIDDLRASGTLASNPAFLQSIRNEQARMEDDAEDFKYWPIVQVHFLYRF